MNKDELQSALRGHLPFTKVDVVDAMTPSVDGEMVHCGYIVRATGERRGERYVVVMQVSDHFVEYADLDCIKLIANDIRDELTKLSS